VYFLQESHSGFYQIYFGSGVLGAQPVDGNYVDVDYIVTDDYDVANGCRLFGFSGSIGTATGISITTTQISFGGANKEEMSSIKYNAVKSNSAKNRAVTENDYELLLKQDFNFIKSVSVWGGENNVPPVYGKVFLSVQPVDGFSVSTSVKNDVLIPSIRKSSLLTIIPEFVDPTYTNLEFTTKIKFNPLKTTTSQVTVEGLVKDTVQAYVDSISTFNTDYLESELVSEVLGSDGGIVSVSINKRVGFKMSPLIGVESNHVRGINNPIKQGSIKSTKFTVFYENQYTVTIKEIPNRTSQIINSDLTVQTIAALGIYSGADLVKEIGSVNLFTGVFDLTFSLFAYISSTRFISLSCVPENDDIVVRRNQILNLDNIEDDSRIGLLSSNIVVTELYGK
jgi:hypothetical protein